MGTARHQAGRCVAALAVLPLLLTTQVGTAPRDAPGAEPASDAIVDARRVNARRVILVSIDGLNPRAIKKLGKKGTPTLHRLIRKGTGTLNARTLRERTQTLPNHTGMITGRRVRATAGGHGVTFNADPGDTVHDAAGEHVASVFSVVHAAGGETALFTSKEKFAFFARSWPGAIDRYTYRGGNRLLARQVVKELPRRRAFTMVHFSAPDAAGHAHGFLSRPYLKAVRRTDRNLGRIVRALRHDASLRRNTVVLVTADHGGPRRHKLHDRARLRANYRVPLIAWGHGVARGDLYALNRAFKNPRKARTTYRGRQPVRNGMVANLSTGLLGLGSVPGSTLDRRQRLTVLR